ncbi:MAG: hypothetical protein RL077_1925 [Verrucomicrobiota bacterium]|jgi:hypothetical protein
MSVGIDEAHSSDHPSQEELRADTTLNYPPTACANPINRAAPRRLPSPASPAGRAVEPSGQPPSDGLK